MDKNTFRTTLGFLATLVRKWTGIELRANRPEAVYNYHPISDRLRTSGQPTEKQFAAIKAAGFDHVINLAPHEAENALSDEAKTLSALDIDYTHIPVDFKNPTDADFEKFVSVLEASGDAPLWVHCAANMRVSAFVYRYRRDVLKEDESAIRKDLNTIWEPFGVWEKFVGRK